MQVINQKIKKDEVEFILDIGSKNEETPYLQASYWYFKHCMIFSIFGCKYKSENGYNMVSILHDFKPHTYKLKTGISRISKKAMRENIEVLNEDIIIMISNACELGISENDANEIYILFKQTVEKHF